MITNAASYKFFRCTCCLQRYGAIIAGSKFPNYKPNEIKNPGKRSLAALANRYYPDLKMDKSYIHMLLMCMKILLHIFKINHKVILNLESFYVGRFLINKLLAMSGSY